MFNRSVQGKLPTIASRLVVNRHKEAQTNQGEQSQRAKAKQYADNRRHARSSTIRIGDLVLVKQQRHNKLATNFSPEPYTVIAIKGSKVVAKNKDHQITRNSSFFRKIPKEMAGEDDDMPVIGITRGNAVETQRGDNQHGLRRSTRNRMPTEHYGQPVHSSIIT